MYLAVHMRVPGAVLHGDCSDEGHCESDSEPLDELLVDDALVDVLRESESYRSLALEAIHALHILQTRYDALQRQHRATRDELRALRGTETRRAA
ncbi:MAG: hypothetical protein WD227_10945 [Vicinamibacterales bacterium]